jgi:pilus assembly protein CpaC
MNTSFRRYAIALTLMARIVLANAQVERGPEAPLAPPSTSGGPTMRAAAESDSRNVVAQPSLALYDGEVKVLDLTDVERIAVGNGGALKANVVSSNQVVLIGQRPGSSSLRVWTRNGKQYTYEVTVRDFDIAQILRDTQDMLGSESGISVRQLDGHILVEGDYSNPRTASRIQALQAIYPQIISTVPVRQETPSVRPERMVYMEVRVVEILKSTLRRLGVNWAGTTQGGFNAALNLNGSKNMAKPANGGMFGIAANLSSQLDLLEQAGESWTLAEPTVSCKSGGSAKFTVGGEIPVPVSTGFGQTSVIYKEYGVIMEFKPIADDQGNISSSIVAEVSQPDNSLSNVGNNGLIAFIKTRTDTEVSLKENQTLVISGLLKNSGSRGANGIPGAKDVPVLGNLFKSKQFQNDRTELVVMVTPRSVSSQQELNTATIKRANDIQKNLDPIISRINGKLAE